MGVKSKHKGKQLSHIDNEPTEIGKKHGFQCIRRVRFNHETIKSICVNNYDWGSGDFVGRYTDDFWRLFVMGVV